MQSSLCPGWVSNGSQQEYKCSAEAAQSLCSVPESRVKLGAWFLSVATVQVVLMEMDFVESPPTEGEGGGS